MAFFDELSYPEIAVILGCPEGTVKTRMFHARAKLKRCLSALGAEAP
jgi:RNA polymerase sigma-70 factor (ECF subfamily)